MQEQNNHVHSEQQTLPTTAPFTNFLYPATNNFNVDSNRGQYGVMTPYNVFTMNQWPYTEGLNVPSNMTGNQNTTLSYTGGIPISNSVANNVPTVPANQAVPGSSNVDMVPNSSAVVNNITPFISTPVSSTYGVGDYGNLPITGLENGILTFSKSVLYPPFPPPLQIRSIKPFECNTVFVRGLPEKATEDIVKEVFKIAGEIFSVKIQKKMCTIRFFRQSSVDKAFGFHGWEIKIENKDDAPYRGKLYIDYALNNQHLPDSGQQEAQDDASYRETTEPGFHSPKLYVAYSEQEISKLAEKLDDEKDFNDAITILTSWLERGECNKRNASSFYSVIQKTHNHAQKLMNEKAKFEVDLNKAKAGLLDKMQAITAQLKEFEKVLESSRVQKVWDNFSKAQRKHIDTWGRDISKIKSEFSDVMVLDRIEDEMEMSDEEGNRPAGDVKESEELIKLSEEVDSLQNQLNCAEEEMKMVQEEKEEEVIKVRQRLQDSMHSIEDKKKLVDNFKKLLENAEINESTKKCVNQPKGQHSMIDLVSKNPEHVQHIVEVKESEIRQIGLIATFLNAHPFGASLDYISSYLYTIDCDINTRDIEHLMKQFPTVFIEESFGVGSTLRKKWKFSGLIF